MAFVANETVFIIYLRHWIMQLSWCISSVTQYHLSII